MNALQLAITFAGTILFPALAMYIKSEITKKLQEFELRLWSKMNESQVVHADLDKRLAVVENGHASISDRLDQLVNAMHGDEERRTRRAHGD